MLTPPRIAAGRSGRFGRTRVAGFTLLEVMVVLVVGAVLTAMATIAFSGANARTSARSAAQVFARDLTLARSMAVRGRESVVIRFFEDSRWYTVTTAGGRELARRRYGTDGEVRLTALDLELAGDSLVFSQRGLGDLAGASLGTAAFTAGTTTFEVDFNSMGASKLDEL